QRSDPPARRPAPRSEKASPQPTCEPLDVEGFTAAATAFLVGIVKCKAALQLFLDVVHLGAKDEHNRLGVDQYRHALVFDNFVELRLLVGVFDCVAEPRAAA